MQATLGGVFITMRMEDALGNILRNRPGYLSACLVDRTAAVAQVLAYVYRLKAALRGEGRMPDSLVEPYVPPELDPLNRTPVQGAAV